MSQSPVFENGAVMILKKTMRESASHFSRPPEFPVTITLSRKKTITLLEDLGDRPPLKRGFYIECRFETSPPGIVVETLYGLRERRLVLDDPPQVELPYGWIDEKIDINGNIAPNLIPPLTVLPRRAQEWLRQKSSELSTTIRDYAQVMRWHQAAYGPHNSLAFCSFKWSDNGAEWRELPTEHSVLIMGGRGLAPNSPSQAAELFISGAREPLAHELIREAEHLFSTAPRSSIVIAFAALEAGLKELLTTKIPLAEQLIAKMPSPSVEVIMRDVLPSVAAGTSVKPLHIPIPSPVIEVVRKWAFQRNQVAHGVRSEIDSKELQQFLKLVQDILYIFDAWNGREWAARRLQTDFFKSAR